MKSNTRAPNQGSAGVPNSNTDSGPDETLKSERIQVERKLFLFTLKENPRGRFLRITEDVGGRRDTIIIPATGLMEFARAIEAMASATGPDAARGSPAGSGSGPTESQSTDSRHP